MIRLVILDFDGTMADTHQLITDTMIETLRKLNLPTRTREECAATIGLPLKGCFEALMPMSDETAEKCADTYSEIFTLKNQPGIVPAFPNVKETIRTLHEKGIKLSIASSRHNASLMQFLNDMQLTSYIPYVLGADKVKRAKPHPEPVLKTLEHMDVPADETLVVGDTAFDIEMGVRAGAHTCGVTYGNGTKEQMENAGAQHIIDDFKELLQIVEDYEKQKK